MLMYGNREFIVQFPIFGDSNLFIIYLIYLLNEFKLPQYGNQKLRRSYGNGPVVSENQILDAFNNQKEEISSAQMITIQNNDTSLKPLKNQIRRFFEWRFDINSCYSREFSGQRQLDKITQLFFVKYYIIQKNWKEKKIKIKIKILKK